MDLNELIHLRIPIRIVPDEKLTNGTLPKNLPKASFRLIANHKNRHTPALKKKRTYFRYEEPTAEELMNRVEYDMDDLDEVWLSELNEKLGARYDVAVSEDLFERIMDRLEKESYFESKQEGKDVLPDVDEDAVCSICNDGECYPANTILFCDMCNLAVHQECYGVPYIPDGQWHCRRCLQSPAIMPDCILCPNKGGALKLTDDNRWAHVICALWVPEVAFANTVFLEPVDCIENIPKARWNLICYLCKQRKGACIQCNKDSCYQPFHVTCAQQAGLYMKIRNQRYRTQDGEFVDAHREAFCDLHAPKHYKRGSRKMYIHDDANDERTVDQKSYKKWRKSQKDRMKNARKILSERRDTTRFNSVAKPSIKEETIGEIAKLLKFGNGRWKRSLKELDELRCDYMRHIRGYWMKKRMLRNGVPLLRRLQVAFTNSGNNSKQSTIDSANQKKYETLRYDLEKARLLVGQVQKRENLKRRLFLLSSEIVEKKFKFIDKNNPARDD